VEAARQRATGPLAASPRGGGPGAPAAQATGERWGLPDVSASRSASRSAPRSRIDSTD
jgi:hypothetical protein